MAKAGRLLALAQLLRHHRYPVTAEYLARELEVSVRTLYRDIETLSASGAPIRGEAGVGYVLEAGFDLPPLMFNVDELDAIRIGLRWVRERGDLTLSRAADDALAKIGAVVPGPLKDGFLESALFAPLIGKAAALELVDMAPLREAIRKGLKADILYGDQKGKLTQRVIWTFGLAYFDTVRVIMAWCEMRESFRHFRTDRIRSLQLLGKYPARQKELLRRWEHEEYVKLANVHPLDSDQLD